ncbi:outer membrane beta-barrel family protein [Spirosoma terrae]
MFNQLIYNQELNVEGNIDLGRIKSQVTLNLKEVSIIKKRPLVERSIDRLTFNVGQSIVSTGSTALEALRVTPLMDVQDNALKIVGKGTVGLLINGRFQQLSESDIITYLRSIRSESIEKIEVITTPPANFDASGNSGLINIVLKKSDSEGFSGTVGNAFRQRTLPGTSPFANITYQKNRFNLSLSLSSDIEGKRPNSNLLINTNSKAISVHSIRKDYSKVFSSTLNLNYNIDKKTAIGINLNQFTTLINSVNNTNNQYTSFGSPDSTILTNAGNNSESGFLSLLGYIDRQLDSSGKKLSFAINYLQKNSSEKIDLSSTTEINKEISSGVRVLNPTDAGYKVFTSNLDFIMPFKLFKIEAGAKVSFVNNSSNTSFSSIRLAEEFPFWAQWNQFYYKEQIGSVYAGVTRKFKNALTLKAGLRLESSLMEGRSAIANTSVRRTFTNLFPSLFLSYLYNEDKTLTFAYSRRINRPGFNALNPNRYYQNQYIYSTGNPSLQPYYVNTAELGLNTTNVNLMLFGTLQKNSFTQVTSINGDSLISSPLNAYDESTVGLSISHQFNKVSFFDSYNTIRCSYNAATPFISYLNIPINRGYYTYFSSNNNVYLDKEKKYILTLNYFLSLPGNTGIYQLEARSSVDIGFKTSFFSKKLNVNVAVFDVFKTNYNQNSRFIQDSKQYIYIYNDMRHINVAMTYNFGSKKIRSVNKTINTEEKGRIY